MIPVLGIDPGHTGGAVLLSPGGREVWGACSWVRRERKAGRLYATVRRELGVTGLLRPIERRDEASLHAVGEALESMIDYARAWQHCGLVVEGLSLHRRAAPASVVELGRTVGLLTGPLIEGTTLLGEPLATSWRRTILGRGGLSSDESEAAARGLCVAMGWSEALGELLEDGHVAEAACLARWGVGSYQLAEAQQGRET